MPEGLSGHAMVPGIAGLTGLRLGVGPLLLFGLVVHAACVLWFQLYPPEILAQIMADVALPFVLTLTPATAILGLLVLDIERRNDTERSLSISQERLRAITDALPDLVLLIDEDGRFLEILSAAAARSLLYAEVSDLLGKTMLDVLPGGDAEKFLAVIRRTLDTGQPQTIECELAVRKGPVAFQGRTSPLQTLFGGKRAVVFATRDVTDQRRNEEKLRRVQRMEVIGQLAGGIAHDFNNILGIAQGNLELLREMVTDGKPVMDRIDKAMAALERATAITRRLLGFAQRGTGGTRLTLVNDLIGNVAELFAKSPTASIQVALRLADDLWTVNVDPGDLQDAVLNLTLNAREAMPKGGRLTIETANVVLDAHAAAAGQPPGAAGEFVMIAVSDSGIGMSEAVKEKIFEPFFSTKTTGRGIGLGLSLVYGFVQRSGGLIRVDSAPDEGAVFHLYLPRATGSADGTATAAERLPRGTETVLIVDDEESLVEIAGMYLRGLGYRTLTAEDGPHALAMLRDETQVDLLFSDVVMPGLDGYALATEARRLRPGLPVLLASGYSIARRTEGDDGSLVRLADTLLKKPYSQAELAQAVRRTLDAEAG